MLFLDLPQSQTGSRGLSQLYVSINTKDSSSDLLLFALSIVFLRGTGLLKKIWKVRENTRKIKMTELHLNKPIVNILVYFLPVFFFPSACMEYEEMIVLF